MKAYIAHSPEDYCDPNTIIHFPDTEGYTLTGIDRGIKWVYKALMNSIH